MQPQSQIQQIDTTPVRPTERFEYWRSLHPGAELTPLGRDATRDFRGAQMRNVSPEGVAFARTRADDVIAYFAQPQGDFLMINLTVSGAADLTQPGGVEVAVSAGPALIVLDSTHPITSRSHDHEMLSLILPLPLLRDELCSDKWPPSAGIASLHKPGLMPFLQNQMLMMAQTGASLGPDELGRALKSMKELALGVLEQADPGEVGQAEGLPDQAIHEATLHYIALNFSHTDLSVERIAMVIGCSRAKLYRVFEERHGTVGAAIRRVRIDHAKSVLLVEPPLPVKLVAFQCGYHSPETFGRAFRAQTGMTPSEYRHDRAATGGATSAT